MIFEGLLQGLTEFLPISSSGHLALIQLISQQGSIESTVLLHLGTLLAVIIFFRNDIIRILRGLMRGLADSETKLFLFIIIGTIPAVVGGLVLRRTVDLIFHSSITTFALLAINGTFLLGTKFVQRRDREVNLTSALIIGIYQAIAILPGISRSGATIAIGIYLGINPISAFRFSFLLSIPAILGAGVLEMSGTSASIATGWIGFLISFLSGLVALFILRHLVVQRLFYIFGVYCIIIGCVGLIFF
ncbi:MAG TPA: undecaprenyl-diphosphate phosphatase [bacterium (Candidatus Stahlbacteria)]|nr:undecaprenyl-diphosphate phosphatase [Candidatus Stahlbacteria bacterium]